MRVVVGAVFSTRSRIEVFKVISRDLKQCRIGFQSKRVIDAVDHAGPEDLGTAEILDLDRRAAPFAQFLRRTGRVGLVFGDQVSEASDDPSNATRRTPGDTGPHDASPR